MSRLKRVVKGLKAVAEDVEEMLPRAGRAAQKVKTTPKLEKAKPLAAKAEKALSVKKKEPSLVSAVRVGGKTYKGRTHLDALRAIPDPELRREATFDAGNRGFLNERGRFLDRYKAADYARAFDLFAPDAPAWARNAAEVISENLKVPAYLEPQPTNVAFGTSERVPYVASKHLSGVVGGDDATRAAYSSDPRASWSPEGRDIIVEAMGGEQMPPMEATGFYTPPGGSLEINPATVTRPFVGVSEGAVDPASRGMMDLSEAVRGYIDAQGASAWHKPIADANPADMGSVFIPTEGATSGENLLRLRELGEPYGLTDVVDTGQGVTLTNFYPGPPSGEATGEALRGDLGVALRDVAGGVPQRVKIDSGYQPLFELEEQGPGTGVVTRELERLMSQYPEDVINRLSASQAIRNRAMSGRALDAEMAARGYGEARPDIQRARELIGTGGFRSLFDALKRGEALPALVPLSVYGASSQEDEQ